MRVGRKSAVARARSGGSVPAWGGPNGTWGAPPSDVRRPLGRGAPPELHDDRLPTSGQQVLLEVVFRDSRSRGKPGPAAGRLITLTNAAQEAHDLP